MYGCKFQIPEVSVIIPLFGHHYGMQNIGMVIRAWLQQDMLCEVIVVLGGDVDLDKLAINAEHHNLRVIQSHTVVTSGSPLRNIGAQCGRAHLLYHSDADIIPLSSDFLEWAVSLMSDHSSKNIVAHPWIYRLISKIPPGHHAWMPPVGALACYVTANSDGTLNPVPGERFDWSGRSPLAILPPALKASLELRDHRRAVATYHGGGILVAKEDFDAVGGFCLDYERYGCQDHDLLFKLSSRRRIVEAWRINSANACLHFEHHHAYKKELVSANRALLTRRISMGAETMIHLDTCNRDQRLQAT